MVTPLNLVTQGQLDIMREEVSPSYNPNGKDEEDDSLSSIELIGFDVDCDADDEPETNFAMLACCGGNADAKNELRSITAKGGIAAAD